MTEKLNRTVLYEKHLSLGAKTVRFAGWEMPVQYEEGIIAEHKHTREKVSVFDISHMGEFRIKGKESANLLDRIFPRSTKAQKIGTCRYNFLLSDKGTILDDLIIYRMEENEFFIVVNAGTKDSDARYLRKLLGDKVLFEDESDDTVKIDLQGPCSAEVLVNYGFRKEELPAYYKWIKTNLFGVECLLSRTGYTGELGFEIYYKREYADIIWNKLLEHPLVKPAGLGARDTLRLEMGYPLYGHELDENTTPIEAGFGGMLKLDGGRNFIAKEVLKNKPPTKMLYGFEFEGRRTARQGAKILKENKQMGVITSGAFAPSLGKAVGLGYIFGSGLSVSEGDTFDIEISRGMLNARVVSLPFYKYGTVRNTL